MARREANGDVTAKKGPLPGNWYRVPLAIFLLGLLSTALLVWIKTLGETQRACASFSHSIREIQLDVALAHLWLEERLAGEQDIDPGEIQQGLDRALSRTGLLVEDGGAGATFASSIDSEIRQQLATTLVLLKSFKEVAEERLLDPGNSGIGSGIELRFDALFRRILEITVPLEKRAEETEGRNDASARRLFLGILVIWVVVILTTAMGFWRAERQKTAAALALHEAHEKLEWRVSERTRELTEVNRSLESEILERRRAEAALRTSESDCRRISLEFRTLLDAIPDAIFLIGPDSRILWANRGAADMTGIPIDELTGKLCHEILHGLKAPCELCAPRESRLTGSPASLQVTIGDGRILDVRAFPIRNEEGRILNVLELAEDITERVAMEAETLRAAHLASLGELAAGVAHEVNNPINGVINYAQILSNMSPRGGEQQEISQRIIKEGGRIANIVRGLLSFARERKDSREPVCIEKILDETLLLTNSQLRKSAIEVRLDIPGNLPSIEANPQQIQQVLLNVVSNARYALNEKYPEPHPEKVLEIACHKMPLDERDAVGIAFFDHGIGIPSDIQDRIRTPFFSTKPRGIGTGLGLSISHGIVNDHGGKLTIESVEGEFTRVEIILPAKENRDGTHSHC